MKEFLNGLIGTVPAITDKVVAHIDQVQKLPHDIAKMADRQVQEVMQIQIAVNKQIL